MTQHSPMTPGPASPLVPHRGALILVLGILGIVISCLPFGLVAWVMGRNDIKRIDRGEMDREGRGLTQAGMICGIIGTVFFALSLLYWVVMAVALVAGAGIAAASGSSP